MNALTGLSSGNQLWDASWGPTGIADTDPGTLNFDWR
jgi:hypothetical protein